MPRVAAWALGVLVVACFSPQYGDTTRCGTAGECPPGRSCSGGVCLALSTEMPDGGTSVVPGSVQITVVKAMASGRGSVTSSTPGIDCGPACTSANASFPAGSTLT